MHEHGFKVYVGLMREQLPPNELIETCKSRTEIDGKVIFNNCKVDSDKNDKKRKQLELEKIDGTEELKPRLVQKLNAIPPHHKGDATLALLSLSNCK